MSDRLYRSLKSRGRSLKSIKGTRSGLSTEERIREERTRLPCSLCEALLLRRSEASSTPRVEDRAAKRTFRSALSAAKWINKCPSFIVHKEPATIGRASDIASG
jgi:hypothetical protein